MLYHQNDKNQKTMKCKQMKNETKLVLPFGILVEIFECEFFHTYILMARRASHLTFGSKARGPQVSPVNTWIRYLLSVTNPAGILSAFAPFPIVRFGSDPYRFI